MGQLFLLLSFLGPGVASPPYELAGRREQLSGAQAVSKHPVYPGIALRDSLLALSNEGRIAFVVESEPITDQGPAPHGEPDRKTSLSERITLLASRYGYSASQQGRVVVMTKLYKDRRELPDVTLEECLYSLRSAQRIMEAFNPRVPPESPAAYPLAQGIGPLLSSEQSTAMSQGGLPVSALAQPARDEVWRIARYFYVQSRAQQMEPFTQTLERVVKEDPRFRVNEVNGVQTVGYDLPAGPRRDPQYTPLADPVTVLAARGMTVTQSGTRNGMPVPQTDLTDPGDAPAFELPHVAGTLASIVAAFRSRDDPELRYKVDSELADKTAIVVGGSSVAARDLVKALATIYGLRLTGPHDLVVLLTRKQAHVVGNAVDLGRAVLAALPEPLIRAFEGRLKFEARRGGAGAGLTLTDYHLASDILRAEAIKRLRRALPGEILASRDGYLRLSQLSPRQRMDLAVALIAWALVPAGDLGDQPAPDYIARFDESVLTGGVYEDAAGRPRLNLFISTPDPVTGQSRKGAGFSNGRFSRP